jgi:hypothetical protein
MDPVVEQLVRSLSQLITLYVLDNYYIMHDCFGLIFETYIIYICIVNKSKEKKTQKHFFIFE